MGWSNRKRDLKQFYENYWRYRKNKGHLYSQKSFPRRFSLILNLVGCGNKILDVGCGEGFLSKMLIEKGNSVVGIDISEDAVELARKNGVEAYLCNIEQETPPFAEKSFDVIILSEIIEHLVSPDDVLERLKSYLKDEGVFIITFPNIAFYKYRLDLLRGRFPKQHLYDNSEHLHYWAIPEFTIFLKSCGLKVLRIIPHYSFPLYRLVSKITPLVKILKRFDNLLGYQIVVLASPIKLLI